MLTGQDYRQKVWRQKSSDGQSIVLLFNEVHTSLVSFPHKMDVSIRWLPKSIAFWLVESLAALGA